MAIWPMVKIICGESRKYAIAMLFQLEKRFKNNQTLAIEHSNFINEYIALASKT